MLIELRGQKDTDNISSHAHHFTSLPNPISKMSMFSYSLFFLLLFLFIIFFSKSESYNDSRTGLTLYS